MKKKAFGCRFLGILLVLLFLFGSAQAIYNEYWDDPAEKLVSFGCTATEWLEKYNELTASDEYADYGVESVSESEEDGFLVHSYVIIPALKVNLYCDPATDAILKAFVIYTWADLSEKDMELPDKMMNPLYTQMVLATGYDAEASDQLAEAVEFVDPAGLDRGMFRTRYAGDYVYCSSYENGFWTEGIFIQK